MKKWIKQHPDVWEFIKFNILSNIATITNFIVLWIGSNLLFTSFSNRTFRWLIFKYSISNGGLNGFLSFLLAYVIAQIVNYIIQRKFVFGVQNDISKTLHWYILTVIVAGIISIVLPPYTTAIFQTLGISLSFAQICANIINVIIQVLINYPMMKFVIMK
ncbi:MULTISPECIES: GtrA family protein [Streptococcus]|uniref:GtrA family protein n=1 Tax=Streptococcus caledonicus TaxID=2614158 RepID=A0ABW0UCD9_9STRE|nr:GtrA family protein [Streptococcus sp. S784/96/1]